MRSCTIYSLVAMFACLSLFPIPTKCPAVRYVFGLKLAANKQESRWWSPTNIHSTFVKHGYLLQLSSMAHKEILLCSDIVTNPGPHRSSLTCFVQNTRSLKEVVADGGIHESKLSILQDIVYGYDLDIVCLSETWLNADVLDHEILPTGYNVYRKDRPVKRGGGVLTE